MPLEAQRRKVVLLCAAVACMAAPCVVFAHYFPKFVWAWIALMLIALIYASIEFAKLKRKRR